jgi:hypothetical protein
MSVNYVPNRATQEPKQPREQSWPSPPDPGDLSKRVARRRAELHLSKAQVAARAGRLGRGVAIGGTPMEPAPVAGRPAGTIRGQGPAGSGGRPLAERTAAPQGEHQTYRAARGRGETDATRTQDHEMRAGPGRNRCVQRADGSVPGRFPVHRVRRGPLGQRRARPQRTASAERAVPGPGHTASRGPAPDRVRSTL